MSVCAICMCEALPTAGGHPLNKPKMAKCSNPRCEMELCTDCFSRFIELCFKEKSVPKCMAPECNSLYLRNKCPTTNLEIVELYDLSLFRGLLRDPQLEEESKKIAHRQRLFEQVVKERREFLKSSFPPSIQKAVEILYSADLKRIHKNNQKAISDQLTKMERKRCFRLFCRGVMTFQKSTPPRDASSLYQDNEDDRDKGDKGGDGDKGKDRKKNGKWVCGACESQFCVCCEGRLDGREPHVCKKEEVASVELKKSLPQCPKCGQSVEKADGCDAITCAVCKQNFSYSTGKPCQAGNHGKSIPVELAVESIDSLYKLLPAHDPIKTRQFKEELKLIQQVFTDQHISNATLTQTPAPWEWKISDISTLTKCLYSKSGENKEVNEKGTESGTEKGIERGIERGIDPMEEKKLAKLTALRVEKLETRRQQVRAALHRLKMVEDQLHSV